MTYETRATIELRDIEAVEVECRKCRAKVVRKIKDFKQPPAFCSNCQEQWLIDGSQAHTELTYFLRQIERFSNDEGEKFSLRLEIKQPPE